jgi:argininosuccinate lyase
MAAQKTIVGRIDREALAFTVGKDPVLDLELAEADCLGTAAHVTMLSRARLPRRLFSTADVRRVIEVLREIIRQSREGRFRITSGDQDVHLAVERRLTERLGPLGKKVHTARSRNDQVAVDLRLYGKARLIEVMDGCTALFDALAAAARRHRLTPMVGRTHLQPAMPSTVGLWAAGHAESLLDDLELLGSAYAVNDRCPLGAAAGYGVALKIDRALTARLLGFARPHYSVTYAGNARGKCEAAVLQALSQVMLTLSRLAEDLVLFSMPEFNYFRLPADLCTGSSIMPQKNNPDILELVRARAAKVLGHAAAVGGIVKALPSGYNRDLQETKECFIEGLASACASLRMMARVVKGLRVNGEALRRGFAPAVFAADRALEMVAEGVPFRDAYDRVKAHLDALQGVRPDVAVAARFGRGGAASVDSAGLEEAGRAWRRFVRRERARFRRVACRLVGPIR